MSADDLVLVEHPRPRIAVVRLNRPEALNALSRRLREQIVSTFEAFRSDDRTEVIILTCAGRAFTVGLDLKELGGEVDGSVSVPAARLSEALTDLPQVLIGAVNGYAITGGFELALMCDFLVAATGAQFADTHARVGVGIGLSLIHI